MSIYHQMLGSANMLQIKSKFNDRLQDNFSEYKTNISPENNQYQGVEKPFHEDESPLPNVESQDSITLETQGKMNFKKQ